MKLFGLTGGIGMGKTAAAEIFEEVGLPVIDTDSIARKVVEPGQPVLAALVARFGPELLGGQGQLQRKIFADLIFKDADARRDAEAIMHPAIRETWQRAVTCWKTQGRQAGVVVIPLLFETKAEGYFDFTLCVACSDSTQQLRLVTRQWSGEEISLRITSQMAIREKMQAADFVIWNEGTLTGLKEQLLQVLKQVIGYESTF